MKKITKILLLAGALSAFGVTESKAQEIVISAKLHAPPPPPKPPRPSSHHVWVGEEWTPSGKTYVYKGGYWAASPFMGAKWSPGSWHKSHNGWVWRPGHWR